MKVTLTIIISFIFAVFASQVVSAHVFISDKDKASGAILHITPDDDPIAGQESMVYFDANNSISGGKAVDVRLEIRNQAGETTAVKTNTDDGLSVARYTFPVQGVYDMRITLAVGDMQRIFEYSQRVSRGAAGSALDQPSYSWAEALVVAGGVTLAGLGIIAINRWQDILRQSKW